MAKRPPAPPTPHTPPTGGGRGDAGGRRAKPGHSATDKRPVVRLTEAFTDPSSLVKLRAC